MFPRVLLEWWRGEKRKSKIREIHESTNNVICSRRKNADMKRSFSSSNLFSTTFCFFFLLLPSHVGLFNFTARPSSASEFHSQAFSAAGRQSGRILIKASSQPTDLLLICEHVRASPSSGVSFTSQTTTTMTSSKRKLKSNYERQIFICKRLEVGLNEMCH